MPFCPKCGFEVSAWMFFCPRCGAQLSPSAAQPRRYGYRLTSFYLPNISLWLILAFLWMIRFNAYGDVAWYAQFMWLALGMVVGLVFGIVAIWKQLKTLTEKGEMRMSVSYVLFMVGGVLVFGAIFLAAMLSFPNSMRVIYVAVMDSILGAGATIILAQTFLVVRWERSHKMRLYHKGWPLKIYAVPNPDSTNSQSTVGA